MIPDTVRYNVESIAYFLISTKNIVYRIVPLSKLRTKTKVKLYTYHNLFLPLFHIKELTEFLFTIYCQFAEVLT